MSNEEIPVRLRLTLRGCKATPDGIRMVAVGAIPVIVISFDATKEAGQEIVTVSIDSTGSDSPEELIEALEGIIEVMKDTPHTKINSDGVTTHEAGDLK